MTSARVAAEARGMMRDLSGMEVLLKLVYVVGKVWRIPDRSTQGGGPGQMRPG
jgi:hypothetical protein